MEQRLPNDCRSSADLWKNQLCNRLWTKALSDRGGVSLNGLSHRPMGLHWGSKVKDLRDWWINASLLLLDMSEDDTVGLDMAIEENQPTMFGFGLPFEKEWKLGFSKQISLDFSISIKTFDIYIHYFSNIRTPNEECRMMKGKSRFK